MNKATASAQTKLYDVFLSHHTNDKQLVEAIARRLEDEANLRPFLDKWHLVPGQPFQEDLEQALDSSTACAVFLGPAGLGPWENEEMRSALNYRVVNKSLRVIPVLLPGADPDKEGSLPRFLQRYTWVDFREGIELPDPFRRLVAGIAGKSPGRGPVSEGKTTVKFVIVFRVILDKVDQAAIETLTTQLQEISGDATLTIRKVKQGSLILVVESSDEAFERIRSLFDDDKLNEIGGMNVLGIGEYRDRPELSNEVLARLDQKRSADLWDVDPYHEKFNVISELEHAGEVFGGRRVDGDLAILLDGILSEIARFSEIAQVDLAKVEGDLLSVFMDGRINSSEEELQSPAILLNWPAEIRSGFVKWAHRHRSIREGSKTISDLAEHILRSYEVSLKLPTKREGRPKLV